MCVFGFQPFLKVVPSGPPKDAFSPTLNITYHLTFVTSFDGWWRPYDSLRICSTKFGVFFKSYVGICFCGFLSHTSHSSIMHVECSLQVPICVVFIWGPKLFIMFAYIHVNHSTLGKLNTFIHSCLNCEN